MSQEQDIYTTRTMPDGSIWYYKNGQLHREDGPAIENADGGEGYSWFLNGVYHREDGPAVQYADGSKAWWINGFRHRVGGPAIERTDGHNEWWLNGKKHRVGGPAVEWADGYNEWWRNGERIDVRVRIAEHMETWDNSEALKSGASKPGKVFWPSPIIYLKIR